MEKRMFYPVSNFFIPFNPIILKYMGYQSHLVCEFASVFFIFLICMSSCSACKDIIATGDATAGEYNLLLKVRDPSRPGLQVLTMIPANYEYTYHHPWSGEDWLFQVNHSYIGVSSLQDIPPNITKSGMVLTDVGLAYGDADSQSRWINPTRFAWDDFDWIRHSCEQAESEHEAVEFLTTKAVDQLHATGVSENLCLIGPERGYLIEADAYRYTIKEIKDDFDVISNYARDLWKTQLLRSRFIAESYNSSTTKTVNKGDGVHLNGLAQIRILQVNQDFVKVRQIPFFSNIGYHDGKPSLFEPPEIIELGESKTVGDFYISVHNISKNTATITVTTSVNAWEQSLIKRINQKMGEITVSDMIDWSRLQAKDVNDVRAMCEETYLYEGVAIYQVPTENYQFISKGWFSPNHACSSIYVPFHNSNTDIFDKYETGEAAEICLSLYQNHSDSLLPIIESVEQVFLSENDFFDEWAHSSTCPEYEITDVLKIVDTSMQEQAWIMQQLLYNISNLNEKQQLEFFNYSQNLWNETYSSTMISMGEILFNLHFIENASFFKNSIIKLMKSSCWCYINAADCIGESVEVFWLFYEYANFLLDYCLYDDAAWLFQYCIITCKDYFINLS